MGFQMSQVCRRQNHQERYCNEHLLCPPHMFWTGWGPWEQCTAQCGGGIPAHRRTCENGPDCMGCNVATTQLILSLPADGHCIKGIQGGIFQASQRTSHNFQEKAPAPPYPPSGCQPFIRGATLSGVTAYRLQHPAVPGEHTPGSTELSQPAEGQTYLSVLCPEVIVGSHPVDLSGKHHHQQPLKTSIFIRLLPNSDNIRVSNRDM
ncbi:A disintegrin and metalloproteinase with thrombospondin motifs 1-like [Ailuropoda melanoleuca]|uniref:A disintegrin and metalloproteinase with thrombospondin motifs 1-like n=1 Tax=Ailuropoda melanoleuca TaxID=9646 RepID=UPI0014947331|nr:A disintegrin and metalloproteinase with thrombospondin motifs 1-like [Ailuropoda melanoleuca]